MTAARLSPAASLLRNSRLFAIPSPVSLPPTEPSSERITNSDTASSPYPTRAALETPTTSLSRGDWGLKRQLPIKATTKSGTPTIRIRGGIDSPEHIADFESAADHVMTLRKYQELNLRLVLPARKVRDSVNMRTSVFDSEVDHTANEPSPQLNQHASSSWVHKSATEQMPQHLKDTLQQIAKERAAAAPSETPAPPAQPQSAVSQPPPDVSTARRWRYSGPYLAGMNGMEFDAFLKNITRDKKAAFRDLVRNDLVKQREHEQSLQALEEGRVAASHDSPAEVTEEDVTEHLRYLRSEPGKFGPLIAEFFDLADGPRPSSETQDPWSYGRDTIAADPYKESGPPRTHPSAGLSYLKFEKFSQNDVVVGPRATRPPVPARLLKSIQAAHNRHIPFVGVAGFIVPQPTSASTSFSELNWKWAPTKDGPKMVVTPTTATVSQAGKVEIQTKLQTDWHLEDNVPVNDADRKTKEDSNATGKPTPSSQLPSLDRSRYRTSRAAPEPNQDISEELDMMMRAASRTRMNSLR